MCDIGSFVYTDQGCDVLSSCLADNIKSSGSTAQSSDCYNIDSE